MLEPMVSSEGKHKQKSYETLLSQIEALLNKQNNLTTNLSQIVKLLHHHLNVSWTGFYQIGDKVFIPGPHQGKGECHYIPLDEGACGLAYQEERSVLVEDIEQFVGNISCETDYKSEVVLPLFKRGEVMLLFNAKSDEPGFFDKEDKKNLSIIMNYVETIL